VGVRAAEGMFARVRAWDRKTKAVVAAGVASSVPVFVADADGGIIHDVDGNSFIDLGSGIAVTSVGASDPAVVGAVKEAVEHFTHTCFMVTPYEGYVAVAEQLNRLTPGDHEKRTVLFNSGAEAVENAVKVARLDDVLDVTTLKGDILIKIDVQGVEDRVIRVLESLVPATSNQATSNQATSNKAASTTDSVPHSGANSAVSATKS